jgi:hypothetical protein
VTSGVKADFRVVVVVDGQASSYLSNNGSGGSDFRVDFVSPSLYPVSSFVIYVQLSAGNRSVSQVPQIMTLIGTSSAQSELECHSQRSGDAFVRVNETIICSLLIKDANGTTITGVLEDFQQPQVLNGAVIGALLLSLDMTRIAFNVSAGLQIGIVNISFILESGQGLRRSSLLSIGKYWNSTFYLTS